MPNQSCQQQNRCRCSLAEVMNCGKKQLPRLTVAEIVIDETDRGQRIMSADICKDDSIEVYHVARDGSFILLVNQIRKIAMSREFSSRIMVYAPFAAALVG